jgi:hypothetical protein
VFHCPPRRCEWRPSREQRERAQAVGREPLWFAGLSCARQASRPRGAPESGAGRAVAAARWCDPMSLPADPAVRRVNSRSCCRACRAACAAPGTGAVATCELRARRVTAHREQVALALASTRHQNETRLGRERRGRDLVGHWPSSPSTVTSARGPTGTWRVPSAQSGPRVDSGCSAEHAGSPERASVLFSCRRAQCPHSQHARPALDGAGSRAR